MHALNRTISWLDKLVTGLAFLGAALVIIQAVWISYGVFVRYVLNQPDGTVTEATALILVPVAFLGLAYALKEDAYPKVTLIYTLLPQRFQQWLLVINLAIMTAVGGFLSIATSSATLRAFDSGAASEILLWPRFYFWAPVAVALAVFTLCALLRFIRAFIQAKQGLANQELL